jgi:2-iminobutanoate/2-iminopropanoate deaminase
MEIILRAADCSRQDVVKCTVHLLDIEDFDRYNAVYKEFFKDVAVLPARTTVQSVLWNQIKVEIDCVAKKP